MKSHTIGAWLCMLVAAFACCGPSEQPTARLPTSSPKSGSVPPRDAASQMATEPVSEPWQCNSIRDCDDELQQLCAQTESLRKTSARNGQVPPCRLSAECNRNQCDIAVRTPAPPAPVDCVADSDCAFKRSGCCGCGAEPVRADHAAAIQLYWAEACAAQACPAVLDERPICFTKPICKNRVCSNSQPTRPRAPPMPSNGGE